MADALGERELRREVGPGLEIGGGDGTEVAVAVTIVIEDDAVADLDGRGAFDPMRRNGGDGAGDVGVGAREGGRGGEVKILGGFGLEGLVLEDHPEFSGEGEQGGVDVAEAGIEEELGGSVGDEIDCGGGVEAVVEIFLGEVGGLGKAAGDGGGPDDKVAGRGRVEEDFRRPDVAGGGLVGHHGDGLLVGPVEEVGR